MCTRNTIKTYWCWKYRENATYVLLLPRQPAVGLIHEYTGAAIVYMYMYCVCIHVLCVCALSQCVCVMHVSCVNTEFNSQVSNKEINILLKFNEHNNVEEIMPIDHIPIQNIPGHFIVDWTSFSTTVVVQWDNCVQVVVHYMIPACQTIQAEIRSQQQLVNCRWNVPILKLSLPNNKTSFINLWKRLRNFSFLSSYTIWSIIIPYKKLMYIKVTSVSCRAALTVNVSCCEATANLAVYDYTHCILQGGWGTLQQRCTLSHRGSPLYFNHPIHLLSSTATSSSMTHCFR